MRDEENHIFQYQYDATGNLEEITNGRDIVSIRNEYDDKGRVTKQSYPDGGVMLLTYDDIARTVQVTEQNGNQIAYVQDEHMRSVETIWNDGKSQDAYNEQNKQTEEIEKKGKKTK